MNSSTIRLLDASINRAAEGMRTIEEVARFILEEPSLCQTLKSLRHDLQTTANAIDRASRLSSRDTAGDVGTKTTTATEHSRSNIAAVVAAATGRTAESLRVAEEISKTLANSEAGLSQSFESLRYRFYDIAAAVELACGRLDRRQRMGQARVYGLIGAADSDEALVTRMRRLYDGGVDVLQLRDKNVDDRTLYRRAVAGAAVATEAGKLWIINDRADIAAAAGADGVHIGQEEIPPAAARRVVGPECLVGLSTHDLAQVQSAVTQSVDYIGCGPVFPSSTKHFDTHTGVAWLTEVDRCYSKPAFAIGGIDCSNIDKIVETGIGRVAVTAILAEGREADLKRLVEKIS